MNFYKIYWDSGDVMVGILPLVMLVGVWLWFVVYFIKQKAFFQKLVGLSLLLAPLYAVFIGGTQ